MALRFGEPCKTNSLNASHLVNNFYEKGTCNTENIFGTYPCGCAYPALKRWAILDHPSGMKLFKSSWHWAGRLRYLAPSALSNWPYGNALGGEEFLHVANGKFAKMEDAGG